MAYLQHHGIKGQKWGVRRYRYADGTLTPAGKKRYARPSEPRSFSDMMSMRVSEISKTTRTYITGKQYVDGVLESGTTLSRIQTSQTFENFAFYATYKKHDVDEYMGLFGKNLLSRAEGDARRAERAAEASGSEADLKTARDLRDKANNTKVYQLKLETVKKLRIPSDDNASDIVASLLRENEFRSNLVASIDDSKEKMKRPGQQILFDQAQNALRKDLSKLSNSDKIAIYKAFNLSLVHHNAQEIAAQDRFYGELKKKGYSALLDYNDKEYSSYHAKRPVIVFDLDSVKLQSVVTANPKVVERLYRRHNAERLIKEIPEQTFGIVRKYGTKTVSECYSYVKQATDSYLETD